MYFKKKDRMVPPPLSIRRNTVCSNKYTIHSQSYAFINGKLKCELVVILVPSWLTAKRTCLFHNRHVHNSLPENLAYQSSQICNSQF